MSALIRDGQAKRSSVQLHVPFNLYYAGSDLALKFCLIRRRGPDRVVMSPAPRTLASAVVPRKRMNREEFFG
jgi:hypothetical protein